MPAIARRAAVVAMLTPDFMVIMEDAFRRVGHCRDGNSFFEAIGRLVRETPEEAYEVAFMQRLLEATQWQIGS